MLHTMLKLGESALINFSFISCFYPVTSKVLSILAIPIKANWPRAPGQICHSIVLHIGERPGQKKRPSLLRACIF